MMRTDDGPTRSLPDPDPRPAPASAPQHRRWSAVRVVDVDVAPAASPRDGRALVRACVHLGALAPADVYVDVADPRPVADAPDGVRLWSTQRYADGTFLFEGHVPAAIVGRDAVSVRVRPTPDGAVREPVPPLVHRWRGAS